MKERPILFSGKMVRAILAGQKTMTRRIVKPTPWEVMPPRDGKPIWPYGFKLNKGGSCMGEPFPIMCPYGKSGDRLWVRETWDFRIFPECIRVAYGSDGSQKDFPPRADFNPMIYGYDRWRPSIHMPRWASRITLEIVSVRVERLQDISEEDARREGSPPNSPAIDSVSRQFGYPDFSRSWFAQLWDSINTKRGFGWSANPWVWVVEFKAVKP